MRPQRSATESLVKIKSITVLNDTTQSMRMLVVIRHSSVHTWLLVYFCFVQVSFKHKNKYFATRGLQHTRIVKQVSQQSADFRNRSPQVVVFALFGRNTPLPKNPVQLYYCGYRTTGFFPFHPKQRNYSHPSSQSRIMHESDDSSFPTLQVTGFYRVSASVFHSLTLSEVMVICVPDTTLSSIFQVVSAVSPTVAVPRSKDPLIPWSFLSPAIGHRWYVAPVILNRWYYS